MTNKRLKYTFYCIAALLLLFMLKGGMDGGISGDEYLHYNQSVFVYDYFASLGKDTTALNTPVTHLKYYGQSFDNLTTILARWCNIDDLFLFRHISCSLAGWLTVIVTAFFAVWLSGYGAGIIVILLFALSPTFMGHAQNNLKDIPFALSYIAAIFFTQRILFNENKTRISDALLLAASIAFSISIRPGGLLLICYLFFFLFLHYFYKHLKYNHFELSIFKRKLTHIFLISAAAWFLSILLWPYAQLNPILNVWKSYEVMTQFPTTLRQLFEGKIEWSDFMPWYYLPKYMAITIPLIIFTGLAAFVVLSKRIINPDNLLKYSFLIFSILFPVAFVIYEKSNLYGSWRHFLFIYPSIILLAAIGFTCLFKYLKSKYVIIPAVLIMVILAIHPAKFMFRNHPYYYLYYNQLVGSLNGAYGNYETDYYYHSIREGSEWLANHLEKNNPTDSIKIATNFSVNWYFRNYPKVKTFYCQYDERSQRDWDYMVVANSYIPVNRINDKTWPPKNAVHVIYADKVPICAVLKRDTKLDLQGYKALKKGDNAEAIRFFEDASKINSQDELIFYNFAAALVREGKIDSAKTMLQTALKINSGYEPVLMYLGNIAVTQNNPGEAIRYYETLIGCNRKYFEAYIGLSKLLFDKDIAKARTLLKTCLTLNPGYKPAILALADSYRKTDPEVARKYDELANKYK
ncbi:MAG: tetratricopeptide repeat protein [Mariniphaga sp.]|nr:tetratricopeptide repeat protein [Mariniphaga sp.]